MSIPAVLLVLAAFAAIWFIEYKPLTSGGSRRDLVAFVSVMALAFAICFAAAMGWPVPNPTVPVSVIGRALVRLFSL